MYITRQLIMPRGNVQLKTSKMRLLWHFSFYVILFFRNSQNPLAAIYFRFSFGVHYVQTIPLLQNLWALKSRKDIKVLSAIVKVHITMHHLTPAGGIKSTARVLVAVLRLDTTCIRVSNMNNYLESSQFYRYPDTFNRKRFLHNISINEIKLPSHVMVLKRNYKICRA